MRLPRNNQWTQLNSGRLGGFLNKTIGVNMDEVGSVTLSGRPVAEYTETQDSDFGIPMAIVYFDAEYVIVTAKNLFETDLDGNTPIERATSAPTLSVGTDAVACFDRLYVSGDTDLYYYAGSSWTDTTKNLTTGLHHPLARFDNQTTHKLAVGNDNTVQLYAADHTLGNLLTLPSELQVTTMRYRNGWLFVGTQNVNGGEAYIFMWNGSGTEAQYGIPVHANRVFSMTEYGQTVAAITNAGQLIEVVGTSIRTLANLPIYNQAGITWQDSNAVLGKVVNRGMVSDGDRIYINIYGNNVGDWVNGMYSGLWTYNPRNGLSHRAGITDNRVETPVGSSLAANVITTSADFDAETGDPIEVLNAGSVTGISADTTYFVIKTDTDKFSFAKTRSDAHRGIAIVLGGSTTSLGIRTVPLTTVADIYGCEAGAVALVNSTEQPEGLWNRKVIYGGRTDAGIDTLCMLSPAQSVGSFTTQRIYSSQIKDTWQTIYSFINGVYLDIESVVVKIKTEEKLGLTSLPQGITWSDANTFTTTDLTVFGAASVGDEVTILSGTAAGKTAHITAIAVGATVYTIDIDESIGVAAATSTVTINNYKKVDVITNASPSKDIGELTITEKAPWIKIKVEMRGYDINIPFIELVNALDKQK